ncbi:vanadium-dependent haloperoxidase [Larkinella insperata]|uniref:Vanadium-dependent haloperoxidase n=1 Tax=Larkinella insperata TaxID=332158 RepID=A0ABW3Q9I2_9BACT|nr:vanadium-dependent haloperoxidase [Larkinella insperata]
MRYCLLISLFIFHTASAQKAKPDLGRHLQPTVFSLTMVMIHDVANPPAASRFYTYCLLGAYEIVATQNTSIPQSTSFLSHFPKLRIETPTSYNHQIAALLCMLETGRLMLPSGYMLEEDEKKLLETLRKEGYDANVIEQSRVLAQKVAREVVAFAASDNYLKLSTRLRYRPTKGDGYWFPTPPGYIEAIEPHWRTIRPMLIDTCNQFIPQPAVAFSKDSTSAFYKLAYEVYTEGKSLDEKKRFIASYWDCNPFAINTSGHMSIGFKKISPGGHWMNITSIATKKAKTSFDKAVLVHTLVAATLMDAFISCWDEKYRSNRIRPETVINRYIDARWQPLLQTPPFPEYTSGHSVISTAVAEVLTYLIGDNFAFTDDTEVLFELPTRDFKSFRQAAEEAAISRLYGGIHFRDAIESGQQQGKAIGTFVVDKIKRAGVKANQ